MVLQHSSVENPYIGINFPQSYVVIPLALATRNLFHNFYRLDPYFLLKLIIFNTLVCFVIA